MMTRDTHLVEDLETLNEIADTLNRAVDVHGAMERALAHLVELMDLETGWIFAYDEQESDRWWGPGFRLIAHHNLPPAMSLDNADAWGKGCDCQTLCRKGKLGEAYNEVRCSRLASVSGDRRGLTVHASAPLRSGDRILGILNVAAENWNYFSPRALAMLGNVGNQMGAALERARLFDLLQAQRIHEQAALLDFTNQLLGRHDLADLLAYLVTEVRQLLEVDAATVLLPEKDDPRQLRFHAASGWRSDPVGEQRKVPADDRSGSGLAMRTQQPVIYEDIELRETAPWMADWLPGEGFKAAAIVPLVAEGRAIGTLVIDSREPKRVNENDLRFLQLMANQAAIAIEKARLHQEEIQRYRLEEELAVGRQIQLSLLPPECPDVPGWDFAVYYEAARHVGGDFYDYFWLPSGDRSSRLALVVADVADKGVPAALFMALSRTTIRNVAISDRTPAAALMKANELILEDSQTDLFLTAFLADLDLRDGRMAFSNAGHNPPLWYRAETKAFQRLDTPGIALGVLADILLGEQVVDVAGGDLLVFFTDGVTEAMNLLNEEFGLERLEEAVVAAANGSAQSVVDEVVARIRDFTEATPQSDDATVLVVKRILVHESNGTDHTVEPSIEEE